MNLEELRIKKDELIKTYTGVGNEIFKVNNEIDEAQYLSHESSIGKFYKTTYNADAYYKVLSLQNGIVYTKMVHLVKREESLSIFTKSYNINTFFDEVVEIPEDEYRTNYFAALEYMRNCGGV